MKKLLSVLLTVMMVAGLFTTLIPTASAATKEDLSAAFVPPEYTLGEAWYTEDFEDVDAALTDTELFETLGWNADGKTLPSGTTLGVVEDGDNQWASLKGSAKVVPFLTDDRLAGGNYYLEYTQKMISNTNGDGQGLGVVSGGYGTTDVQSNISGNPVGHRRLVWQWNVKERGDLDTLAYFPSHTVSTDICHAIDLDTSATTSANGSNSRGSLLNKEIRFRIVITDDYGFCAYTIDAQNRVKEVASMYGLANHELWTLNAATIANYLSFRILGGPVVLVDDIKVGSVIKEENEKTLTPGLVITEVATDARPAFTATDGAKHRFEWLEVYNAGTEPKNIYDYAIVRRSGFLSYNTSTSKSTDKFATPITEAECNYISYPAEEGGECIAQRTDKTHVYKFTNPVYEDGVLQPGETAILVNASDWWSGYFNADSLTATVDVFKEEYLMASVENKGLGYTEEQVNAMKIINCSYGAGTTCFGMNNSGADLIALAPLAQDGSCPAVGKTFYNTDYVTNYICEMKKTSTMPNHAWIAGHLRYSFTVKSYYSQEYYSFDANNNYLGTGLAVSGRNPGSKVHTVGYVPKNQRRPFTVTYMVDGKEFFTDTARLATAYTLTDQVPTKDGYRFAGWVDAKGNPITGIAAKDVTADVTLTATWEQTTPVAQWLGAQTTVLTDGIYDLRLVAKIPHLKDVASIGFAVSVNGAAEKQVYLHYVYESITTDFGEATFALPDGGYLVALAITDCPENAEFSVKVLTKYKDGTEAVSDATEISYHGLEETMKKSIDLYLIAGQSNAGGHTKVTDAAALYALNPALEQGIAGVLYAGNARSSSGSTLYNHQISLTPTKLGFGRVDGSAQAYMGPEVGMASALSAYYNEESGKTAALIKMAHGGTSLLNKTTGMNQFGNWVSPSYAEHLGVAYENEVGGLYRALLAQVETNVEALKEMGYNDIRICGIYWMQGEADSSSDASVLAEYETALKFLISDLRSDLADIMVELTGDENGAAAMPFIVGTVSETCGAVDNPTATVAKHSAFNAMLRRTVPTVANCYLIENSAYDTVDISGSTPVVVGSDQYHWNQSDAYEIGTHVGECILDNQLYTKDSE